MDGLYPSMFGSLPSWSNLSEMPAGNEFTFVGPDPHTRRNFYGTIKRRPDGSFRVS